MQAAEWKHTQTKDGLPFFNSSRIVDWCKQVAAAFDKYGEKGEKGRLATLLYDVVTHEEAIPAAQRTIPAIVGLDMNDKQQALIAQELMLLREQKATNATKIEVTSSFDRPKPNACNFYTLEKDGTYVACQNTEDRIEAWGLLTQCFRGVDYPRFVSSTRMYDVNALWFKLRDEYDRVAAEDLLDMESNILTSRISEDCKTVRDWLIDFEQGVTYLNNHGTPISDSKMKQILISAISNTKNHSAHKALAPALLLISTTDSSGNNLNKLSYTEAKAIVVLEAQRANIFGTVLSHQITLEGSGYMSNRNTTKRSVPGSATSIHQANVTTTRPDTHDQTEMDTEEYADYFAREFAAFRLGRGGYEPGRPRPSGRGQGKGGRTPLTAADIETMRSEDCERHKKGTCSFGKKCYRKHVGPPGGATIPKPATDSGSAGNNRGCYTCGESGHRAKDCPRKFVSGQPTDKFAAITQTGNTSYVFSVHSEAEVNNTQRTTTFSPQAYRYQLQSTDRRALMISAQSRLIVQSEDEAGAYGIRIRAESNGDPHATLGIMEEEVPEVQKLAYMVKSSNDVSDPSTEHRTEEELIADSGASDNYVRKGIPAISINHDSRSITVHSADERATMTSETQGLAAFQTTVGGASHTILMHNTLGTNHLDVNLLGVRPYCTSTGGSVLFTGAKVLLISENVEELIRRELITGEGRVERGLYVIKGKFLSQLDVNHQPKPETERPNQWSVVCLAVSEQNLGAANIDQEYFLMLSSSYNEGMKKLDLYHQRHGHIGKDRLITIYPDLRDSDLSFCDSCASNIPRAPKSMASRRVPTHVGHIVEADGSGPMRQTGFDGSRYVFVFVDRFSSYGYHATVASKAEFSELAVKYIKICRQRNIRVVILRMDYGGENVSDELMQLCQFEGITPEYALPGKPHQIGSVGSHVGTSFRLTRTSMVNGAIPSLLWPVVFQGIGISRNFTPRSADVGSSPYEIFNNIKDPFIASHLRILGCEIWVLLPSGDKHIEPRAHRGILLGYPDNMKDGYLVLMIGSAKIVVAVDVRTNETRMPFKNPRTWQALGLDYGSSLDVVELSESSDQQTRTRAEETTEPRPASVPGPGAAADEYHGEAEHHSEEPGDGPPPLEEMLREPTPVLAAKIEPTPVITNKAAEPRPELRRSSRQKQMSSAGAESVASAIDFAALTVTPTPRNQNAPSGSQQEHELRNIKRALSMDLKYLQPPPSTLGEARPRPDWEMWKGACHREMDHLEAKGTYGPWVTPCATFDIIGNQWSQFKDGTAVKLCKARNVLCGNQQEANAIGPTYSPGPTDEGRVFIALLAAQLKLLLMFGDVKGAYIEGLFPDTMPAVYTTCFEGFPEKGHERDVRRLLRYQYGLGAAGHQWRKEVHEANLRVGAKMVPAEKCIYVLRWGGQRLFVLWNTDDLMVAADTQDIFLHYIQALKKNEGWEMTMDMPTAPFSYKYCGIWYDRTTARGPVSMHQGPYISALLEKMNMSNCKGSRTPYIANTNWKTELQAATEEEKNDVIGWYLTVLGAFRWIKTRVDLLVQLLKMSSVMHNPGHAVIKHVIKFARYLQHSIDFKWTLQYDASIGTGPFTVSYYPDASWLDGPGQKSTGGMAVFIGRSNLVHAVSKYLPTQATSTTHAEIQMLAIAAHHSLFMRELIEGAGLPLSLPITFWEDNTTARKHSGPDNQQQPTKFIETKYLRVQEMVRAGVAEVHWITTTKQRGNFFTKNESAPTFEEARDKLLQRNGQSYEGEIDVAIGTPMWIMHKPRALMIRSVNESDSSPDMQVRGTRRTYGIAPSAGSLTSTYRALDDFGDLEFRELRLREREKDQRVSREVCAEVKSLDYPVPGVRDEPLLREDITRLKTRHLQEMIDHGHAQAEAFDALRDRQIREAKDILYSRSDAQVVSPTLNDDERIRLLPTICLDIIGMGTPASRRNQAQAIAQQLEGPTASGDVVADLREVFANITRRTGSSGSGTFQAHPRTDPHPSRQPEPHSNPMDTRPDVLWKWRTGKLVHNRKCRKVLRLTLNGEVRSDKLFTVIRGRMAQEGLTACTDSCCPQDGWIPPLSSVEIKRKDIAYRAGSALIGRHLKPTGRRDQYEDDDGSEVDG